MANSIGASKVSWPRHMVPIQLKNLMPVGTAIKKLRAEKNGSSTAPVANMWWAQTPTESPAMDRVAKIMPLYPKTGLRLNVGMMSVMTPK